jgi:hypothetical protein
MKTIVYISILCWIIASCSMEAKNPGEGVELITIQTDSITVDTLKPEIILDSFAMLIEYPEDIVLYKSRKKGSNSGGANIADYYYRPDSVGFYLGFLLFHPMPLNYRGSEGDWFDGLRVGVYRYGTKIGHYHDSTEVFISLKAKLQEPELRSFNLVGKSADYVKGMLGKKYKSLDSCMIYSSTNKVLVVHLLNEKVTWFKYVILQNDFTDFEEIPTSLTKY